VSAVASTGVRFRPDIIAGGKLSQDNSMIIPEDFKENYANEP